MQKIIKRILHRVLGQESYLYIISKIFFTSANLGLLKQQPIYYHWYMLPYFIKPNDVVIDMGANLGYFSKPLAKLVGDNGKVYSVEPLALYRNILVKNIGRFEQVEVLPYALGKDDNVTVQLVNVTDDEMNHGQVSLNYDKSISHDVSFDATQRNPAKLFKDLTRLNFIKCDIEGYEIPVIPLMQNIIEQHRPVLLIETSGNNLEELKNIFSVINYSLYIAIRGKLYLKDEAPENSSDIFFIPNEKVKNHATITA